MDYRTLCHRAFYNPEMRGDYVGCRVSFTHYESNDETAIYSYSTVVARVVHDRDGRKVTLLTNFHYSVTTSGHVSAIASASPYTIIRVPDCETRDMVGTFKRALEAYTIEHGTRLDYFKYANQRKGFLQLLEMFDYYQERVGGLDEIVDLRNSRLITTYEQLCIDLAVEGANRKKCFERAKANYQLSEEEYEQEQARLAKIRRNKEIAEKRKRTIKTKQVLAVIAEYNAKKAINSMLIWQCVHPWRADITDEVREQLLKIRNQFADVQYDTATGTRRASYVFVEQDHISTSQGVRVEIPTVKRLLTMWKAKQNIVGERCEAYRVVANNKDYVQVGCHVIPLWNVQMLYNELCEAS